MASARFNLLAVLCTIPLLTGAWVRAAETDVARTGDAILPFGWRGDGTGLFPKTTPPTTWSREESGASKGILWTTCMPGDSVSSPIVVGDRIFVLSEQAGLLCLDKNSGKPLWMRSNTLLHTLSDEDLKTLQLEALKPDLTKMDAACDSYVNAKPKVGGAGKLEWETNAKVIKSDKKFKVGSSWGGGNTAATPVSDGKFVYAWFPATGVFSCFDMDGKRIYSKFFHPGGCEHNQNSSPLLTGDKIVLYAGGVCYGVDAKSGKELWKQTVGGKPYASPVAAKIGAAPVVVLPNATVINPADGSFVVSSGPGHDGECASPIVDGNRYFLISRWGFGAFALPDSLSSVAHAKAISALAPGKLKEGQKYYPYPVASPVYYEGLVYFTHSGYAADYYKEKGPVLFCVDPVKGEIVYRQDLDLPVRCSYDQFGGGQMGSLMIAGKYLYIWGNTGVTLVVEPGRMFKQVAKNEIKCKSSRNGIPQELTCGSPIAEGGRIYYRGYDNLYCIGDK